MDKELRNSLIKKAFLADILGYGLLSSDNLIVCYIGFLILWYGINITRALINDYLKRNNHD